MRRGQISADALPSVLVDYLCLVTRTLRDTRWDRLASWCCRYLLFGRVVWTRPTIWSVNPYAAQWLNDRSVEVSLDIALTSTEGEDADLVRILLGLWHRNLVMLEDRREMVRRVKAVGYACLVTPDPNLLTEDRSVQLFTGRNHHFTRA